MPLALLVAVLAALGISNWSDFTKQIASGKKDVDTQLEVARQTAKKASAQAMSLQTQYADLQKQFGQISAVANEVRNLNQKVERLEQIQVEQSSALSPKIGANLQHEIIEYRDYLLSLGYRIPTTSLKVIIDPKVYDNAYYDGKTVYVGPKLATMTDVVYREYTERALVETKPEYWATASWKIQAIGSGLGDYFPCSYRGDPKFGVEFTREFGSELPQEIRDRKLLRNLINTRAFVPDSASEKDREQHAAGEVWGGVFWDIRRIMGCKDVTPKCDVADRILLASWSALNPEPSTDVGVRFAGKIVDEIAKSGGAGQASKVREAFARRELKLSR